MTDTYDFGRFLRPASVAIVGASPQRGSSRNSIVRVLMQHGFQGKVYPVTPTHPEVEGHRAYPSVTALPETPDVALIITPAKTVAGIVAECGAKGIRNAIVYSSGFEEVESGREYARQLADAARQHGVAVMGANCQGAWSIRHKAVMTFGAAAQSLQSLQHAPIAVISQSGALAGALANYLQTNGIGCSYVISVGNETSMDALDALRWVVEQDDVRVVGMYVEGLSDASRIIPIAERARSRGVQIVAVKTGRSAVGQEATASHTGKIASSHVVYNDVFAQAGVMSLGTLAEALAAMEAFAYLGHPRVSGLPKSGISVLSSSGGAGALLADHSSECGLSMAEFSPDIAARLESFLPEFARKANPVDLTGQIYSFPNLFHDTSVTLRDDPRTEAIIVQFASSGKKGLIKDAEAFKTVAKDVPVVVSLVGETMDRDTALDFRKAGVVLCSDPSYAMRAMSYLYRRREIQSMPTGKRRPALPDRAAPRDWKETMAFCDASGITPARWTVLGPDDRAGTACAALKYPLVVKVLPADSDHKTELGLVKLNVASPDEVDRLASDFRRRLEKPRAGILVQEMVGDGVEVVLSCLRQTDFGPVLSIGMGGIAIELYRDVTHLALPVSKAQVEAALRKLKLWTVLQGYRGKPPADVEALVEAAVRFGDAFLASPAVVEFEINPVIVLPRGQGLRAVDALVKAN